MRLIKTNYKRLKNLSVSDDLTFISVLTESSLAIWSTKHLNNAFTDHTNEDLMRRLEPTKDIPMSQRLLCSSISIITSDTKIRVKKMKKKSKETVKNTSSVS